MPYSEENIHSGHRKRMLERFLAEGMEYFTETEVLEVLLYYVIPRVDTNVLAHRLLKQFGSLAAVLDAPLPSLLSVDGVGEKTAAFLHMLPAAARAYGISSARETKVVTNSREAADCLRPYFIGQTSEKLYMMTLDSAGKLLGITKVGEGSLQAAGVDMRKLLETAMLTHATNTILAHNHPAFAAVPSREDEQTTGKIKEGLSLLGVRLLDHIIFPTVGNPETDETYYSMQENGKIT